MEHLTIRDIARMTDVSSATVSRVVNGSGLVKEETRVKIQRVISENAYVPNPMARGLSRGRPDTVTVVLPDISNPFFSEVVKGISAIADENHLKIILYDTDETLQRESAFLNGITPVHTRGIIIAPVSDSDDSDSSQLGLVSDRSVPVVLVDRDVKGSNFDGVFIDNIKGARDAVDALLAAGHTDIAIIAGPEGSKPGRERLIGYRNAIEGAGREVDESLICHGDFRLESGYQLTKDILSAARIPTAIFSCNNLMTLGVIKALRENQVSVPEDIALIGFDSIEMLDILGSPISHVARPTYEMGRIAMQLMLDQLEPSIQDDHKVQRVTLTPELVLQGSEVLVPKKK